MVPQLVMAVTTPQVLDSLRQPKPMAADTFFLQAVSEAQRNNVAIADSSALFPPQKLKIDADAIII